MSTRWILGARYCATGLVAKAGLPCREGVEAARPRQHSLTAGCREEAAFTLGPEAGEEARPVTRGRMVILGRGYSKC